MTLHIFNPEHDLALASALPNFTAPHAGRQLRHDLAWLPLLWAKEGDTVVVDDVALSKKALSKRQWLKKHVHVDFVDWRNLAGMNLHSIAPWGWDAALRWRLMRSGVAEHLLPTDTDIDHIRQLSHRRTAMTLLHQLRADLPDAIGIQHECSTIDDVLTQAEVYDRVVLKAPWSSSGRGVRFCTFTDLSTDASSSVVGWLHNTLDRQGSVMLEPYYNKVKDFGMEFLCDAAGQVSCLGLSLFHTQNGAYTGNLIATERAKEDIITRYVPADLLENTKEMVCRRASELLGGKYCGPFGVDMMLCSSQTPAKASASLVLHPCVELNLRRTMGHAALAVSAIVNRQHDDDLRHVMRIDYENNNYKLRLKRI